MPSGAGAVSFILLLFIVIGSFFSVRSASTTAFVLEPFLPVEHRSYDRDFKIGSTKGKLRRLQKVNTHSIMFNMMNNLSYFLQLISPRNCTQKDY